ncbi:MAG: B12-binding domain-containing radical SAM protein [Spirochaetes bacterium]|nr:B12-binding domain-containing radical SAM protein [Spirochaetota bacterium]
MEKLKIFLASVGHRQPVFPLITPPMGLMYIAAYLRSKFDCDIRIISQKLYEISDERLAKEAVNFDADIVGLSALTPNAGAIPYLTGMIRRGLPRSLILLGGPHASAFGEAALAGNSADAAVSGEGERAFEMIINEHFGGGSLANVPGLIWKTKDAITTNQGEIPFIEDLDSLPFPAYDLIDIKAFWKRLSMPAIPRRRYFSIFSSRGCPYKCTYCHRIFGERFRYHSAARIIDEITFLSRKYGVNDVEFLDDIFNLNRGRLHDFCGLVHKNNLKIKIIFPNGVRTDIFKKEDIDALVDAGMYFSCFALESGSPRIQKLIRKNLNIEKFLENVEYAVSRKVFAYGFVMFGFPTETEEDMRMTIDVSCNSRLHAASFFTLIPFPGTETYDAVMRTDPQKLAGLQYDNMEYPSAVVNVSDVPDSLLFSYQRKANRKFFMNPSRIFRILRDHPQTHLLPLYIPAFVTRTTKEIFSPLQPQRAR